MLGMANMASDNSDKLCQQLEISNRFNPHEPSIFPTLPIPFSVTTLFPSSLLTPLNLGLQWVQPMYYFDRLRATFSSSNI